MEVQFDSPILGELAARYMITSIPTLLSFSRQEAQVETRLVDTKRMKDKNLLHEWIEAEARRGSQGGSGGSSLLGKVFGLGR